MIIGPSIKRDLPQGTHGPVALRAIHDVPVDTKQRWLPPLPVGGLVPPAQVAHESPARKAARVRLARIKASKARRAARANELRQAWLRSNTDDRHIWKEQKV